MTGDNTLIHSHGINRRDFMKLCAALAATMGLSSKAAAEMAESVTNPQRPPVIWIGAQECTSNGVILSIWICVGNRPSTGLWNLCVLNWGKVILFIKMSTFVGSRIIILARM